MPQKAASLSALVIMALCVAACSTTGSSVGQSALMPIGQRVAAPAGFHAFCDARPEECFRDGATLFAEEGGGEDLAGDAVSAEAAGVAAIRSGEFEMASLRPDARPATAKAAPMVTFVFTLLPGAEDRLPTRLPLQTERPAPAPAAVRLASASPVVKRDVWPLVQRVNAQVNRKIRPATDLEIYGVEERWAMPLTDGQPPYGDCEDYALEKRRALLDAGLPETALFFAVGVHHRYGRHLVLIVSTDEGDYVLDNMTPWIVKWHEAPYEWRTRQVSAHSREWVEISAPAPVYYAEAEEDSAG